jgi:hypothetical protein
VILDLVGLFAGSLSFSIVSSKPFLSANCFISSSSLRFCSSSLLASASIRSYSESLSSSSSPESSELLFEWLQSSESSARSKCSSSSLFSAAFVGVTQLSKQSNS